MHTQTAYERRETLTDNELERLRFALVDEVERYLDCIRGYSTEKMETYGKPYLEKLQARVDEACAFKMRVKIQSDIQPISSK